MKTGRGRKRIQGKSRSSGGEQGAGAGTEWQELPPQVLRGAEEVGGDLMGSGYVRTKKPGWEGGREQEHESKQGYFRMGPSAREGWPTEWRDVLEGLLAQGSPWGAPRS